MAYALATDREQSVYASVISNSRRAKTMTETTLKTIEIEGETFYRIDPIEIAYIDERGIRRVGDGCYSTDDGEKFFVRHRAGYSVLVTTDQIAA